MFYKKKKKIDLVFWVFGLIALGIIIATGVLLMKLFSVVDDNMNSTDITHIQDVEIKGDISPTFTPKELMENYKKAVKTLQSESIEQENGSFDELVRHIEDELLGMRVPREMQDEHLQVVLDVVKLRAELSQKNDMITKGILDSLLERLLK